MIGLWEVLRISRARLRERSVVVQELFAVLGIAIGVALLFASQVASQSIDGSVRQLTKQIVGGTQYQLDARGSNGFPERVVAEVRAMPGVRAALPLLEQQATVIGPSGQASVDLLGVDPRFATLGGPLLRRFSARQLAHQRAIALPAPLADSIGAGALQAVKLQIGASVLETLVGATLGKREVGGLYNSQVALAPVAYAQRLSGLMGRVTRVFVQVQKGRNAEVAASLQRFARREHLNAEPADFDAKLFYVASASAQQSESLFSAISAVVGFVFAFCAMLLTVPERRRLIAAMRRRGSTRIMTLQVLVLDALVIGAVACLLGLLLGQVLSVDLFHTSPGYLAFAFPVGSQRVVTAATIAEAVAAGMVAALVGVLAPLRDVLARPLRSQTAAERSPRGWNGFRVATGFICLAITTLILLLRPQSAVVAVITLVVAATALLPFLFSAIVGAFDYAQRPFHATSTILAVAELREPATRVRSLAVAATGAIAVLGSVAIAGAQHNLQAGLDRTAAEWNQVSALWVSPSGVANTLGTTAFPASVATKLTLLPGVSSVRIYRGGFLNLGDRRVWMIAPSRNASQPIPAGQLTVGDIATTNERLRGQGWAVVSEAIAHEMHLHIGGLFTLPSPDPTTFRLAGLSTNGGWPPGAIIINSEDYAHAWGSTAASALNIDLASGITVAAGRAQVAQALGPDSGMAIQTATERERQWKTISHQGLARLTQISTLVLIAAILAMAGVMASMIWQRRERIAYKRRLGFTRGLLWRALFFESAVLLSSGCLIGAVFGLYGQLVISHALATVTGFPITISVGPFNAIFSFSVVSATALAIVAIPGYLAVRVRATMVRPA